MSFVLIMAQKRKSSNRQKQLFISWGYIWLTSEPCCIEWCLCIGGNSMLWLHHLITTESARVPEDVTVTNIQIWQVSAHFFSLNGKQMTLNDESMLLWQKSCCHMEVLIVSNQQGKWLISDLSLVVIRGFSLAKKNLKSSLSAHLN